MLLLIALQGCSPSQPTSTEPLPDDPVFAVRPVDPNESDEKSLVLANSDFAFELYARLRTRKGNLLFSPYNVSTALAMTYAGASGDTEAQIARTLRLPFGQDQTHAAFGGLYRGFSNIKSGEFLELRVASRLWGDANAEFLPSFLAVMRDDYGAELGHVDLAHHAEEACHEINRWIESETNGKIRNMVSPDSLDPAAALVLTPAIYFKANWHFPFHEPATKPAPFHVDRGKTVECR